MENNVVYIIDDDPGMRASLAMLLETECLDVRLFESAEDFFKSCHPGIAGCLILDLRMPGMTGLEVQELLTEKHIEIPIIFITAHGDVSSAVKAMKAGSFDFLEKPFSAPILLERVYKALHLNSQQRDEDAKLSAVREKLALLTEREMEVLVLVVQGRPSKQIAELLDLSVSTVDNHRAKIMKKLQAETTADLTRIALQADPRLMHQRLK
jgi:RNA polymerase sigma factor (sigma-70 family)